MSDNPQTTDPLGTLNKEQPDWDLGDPWDPDEVMPPLVRDPGKHEPPAGTPLYKGSQASDF